MKKLIAFLLTAALILAPAVPAMAAESKWTNPFSDVKAGAWYYPAVEYMNSKGYINGTSSTAFSPNAKTTRGMFVTILSRTQGIDPAAYAEKFGFSDAAPGWAKGAVAWAAENKIVNGVGDNKFNANGNVTREQMAVMVLNFAEWQLGKTLVYPGYGDTVVDLVPVPYEPFTDMYKVSGWAKDAVKWCAKNDVIKGSDGKYDPKSTATRSQMAQILMRALQVLEEMKQAKPEPDESATEKATAILDDIDAMIDATPYGDVIDVDREFSEFGPINGSRINPTMVLPADYNYSGGPLLRVRLKYTGPLNDLKITHYCYLDSYLEDMNYESATPGLLDAEKYPYNAAAYERFRWWGLVGEDMMAAFQPIVDKYHALGYEKLNMYLFLTKMKSYTTGTGNNAKTVNGIFPVTVFTVGNDYKLASDKLDYADTTTDNEIKYARTYYTKYDNPLDLTPYLP